MKFFTSYTQKDTKNIQLRYVEPTKVFFITAMPCEKVTAMLRNRSIDAIKSGDTKDIADRYLQSRHGVFFMNKEFEDHASYSLICLIILIFLHAHSVGNNNEKLEILKYVLRALIAFFILNLPPAFVNHIRHQRTEQLCLEALTQTLNAQSIQKIAKLNYYSSDHYDEFVSDVVNKIIEEDTTFVNKI